MINLGIIVEENSPTNCYSPMVVTMAMMHQRKSEYPYMKTFTKQWRGLFIQCQQLKVASNTLKDKYSVSWVTILVH